MLSISMEIHHPYSFHKQVSIPYKEAEFEIIFGEGVSKLVSIAYEKLFLLFFPLEFQRGLRHLMFLYYMQGCILDCAEEMDIVVKKGSWYSYGDQRYD